MVFRHNPVISLHYYHITQRTNQSSQSKQFPIITYTDRTCSRANAKLPSVKTVHNPYHHPSPPPRTLALDDGTNQHLNRDPKDGLNHGSNQAGPSRHPALPSPEWRDCFSTHFAGYKKASTFESISTNNLLCIVITIVVANGLCW